jgi:hypothetical protein
MSAAVALFGLLTATSLAGAVAAGAATAGAGFGYTGSAFGTSVKVGTTLTSGKTSLCGVGCTTTIGAHSSNSAAMVSAPPLLSSGTVATNAVTAAITGGSQVQATSTVEGVSLLGGLVQATTVQAVSTTSETGTGAANRHVSAAGSTFVGLSVLGVPVEATPSPNTTIGLPGIGDVVLNQETPLGGERGSGLSVAMIVIDVTEANLSGYPAGARVVVADAATQIHQPVIGVLQGGAYTTSVQVGHLVSSGRTALAAFSCFSSRDHTNTTATVSVPGVVTSGTATDTADGTITRHSAVGTAGSTVQSVDLLAGLVTASAVTSSAGVNDTRGTITTAGSATFVDLAVTGAPGISSTPPPNTRIAVPGVGVLWLNRITPLASGIRVEAIELDVTVANTLGLALGTVVRVAVASAKVASAAL